MDSFPLRSKPLHHARSISLPSRSHPLTHQVNEQLLKLNETTSPSLSSIGNKLSILENMYASLDDFLLLPSTKQAISKNEKWVEEALDGYLMLLDLCAAAKDISSQIKQDLQGVISTFRRNRDANELGLYLISRKKTKKVIQKSLKNLKKMKTNHKDNESTNMPLLLKEAETSTIAVFESLLSYISGTKSQSRINDLLTKIIPGKNEEEIINEFEKIDNGLEFLVNNSKGKYKNALSIENLAKIEMNIQDLEDGLECLFRRLIKTRVSLLNLLTH